MLGELLLERKMIEAATLERCLREQKTSGQPLGSILINKMSFLKKF